MTGYRAFGYGFVKTFPVLSKGFEIETEMTIHAVSNNMLIENVVVEYRDRPEGSESKLNTISDGIKVLKTILHLFIDYRPMQFFGIIATLLVVVAGAFFVPVLLEFANTGLVPKFPTLIVCGFCVIAAILSFFTGLILSTIKHKERREYEFRLQQIDRWHKELLKEI